VFGGWILGCVLFVWVGFVGVDGGMVGRVVVGDLGVCWGGYGGGCVFMVDFCDLMGRVG